MPAQTKKAPLRTALVVAATMAMAILAGGSADAATVFVQGQTVGSQGQFAIVSGISVRQDGQVLIADADLGDQKVFRFDGSNQLASTASISPSDAGSDLICVAEAGGTEFVVNGLWDKPIRKYDESGAEIAWVPGMGMWQGSGFNGTRGPGNTFCVARAGSYLYAISTGDESPSGSLSRWNLGDLALGPDTSGPPLTEDLVGLATDTAGNVYVVDAGAGSVVSFDADLQLRWSTGDVLGQASGVAVDSPNGLIYVIDNGSGNNVADNRLRIFSVNDGSPVGTVRLSSFPFETTAIAFDQTSGWGPILSNGSSVYRGSFRVQPVLRIISAPRRTTRSRSALFRFASDEAGTAYRCRLDRGRPRRCQASTVFRKLRRGRHTLSVTGTVTGGITSTPVTYIWTIR